MHKNSYLYLSKLRIWKHPLFVGVYYKVSYLIFGDYGFENKKVTMGKEKILYNLHYS